jgi:hypothetical protein
MLLGGRGTSRDGVRNVTFRVGLEVQIVCAAVEDHVTVDARVDVVAAPASARTLRDVAQRNTRLGEGVTFICTWKF